MKYLKYVLIALAALAIGFFAVGFIQSEVSYEIDIMVDKPVEVSWEVAQDPDKMADWLPGYQKSEHVSGTPGTVGAVSDIYFVNNGQEMVIRETITEIKPKESISMVFEDDFMNMDYTLAMSDVDGKTKIKSYTTAKGNGMVSRSFMALLKGTLEDQEVTNLENLKKTIESNTTDYFPVDSTAMDSTAVDSL